MKTKNKVFFGEHGITSTSANHLCVLAKEQARKIHNKLKDLHFITSKARVLSSGQVPDIVCEGQEPDFVKGIPAMLEQCGNLESFEAWMREGIKAKEDETEYWKTYSIEQWVADTKVELPRRTIYEGMVFTEIDHLLNPSFIVGTKATAAQAEISEPTEEDVIGGLDVKTRQLYLARNSKSAVIGKYIHPSREGYRTVCGSFSIAREELISCMANPVKLTSMNDQNVVVNYEASTDCEIVDEVYDFLQDTHRTLEKELNTLKAEIRTKLDILKSEFNTNRMIEQRKFSSACEILESEFAQYKKEQLRKVLNLSIVVPDNLVDIYNYLNSLGKASKGEM